MTMENQAFRIKIAYRPRRNYGGYMRRLRRLYEKKEKAIFKVFIDFQPLSGGFYQAADIRV